MIEISVVQVVQFWFSFLVQTLALQLTWHRYHWLSSTSGNILAMISCQGTWNCLDFLDEWCLKEINNKHRAVIRQWFCWFLVSLQAAVAQNSREFPRVNVSHSHQHGNDVGGRWWSRQGRHHRPGRFRSMAKQESWLFGRSSLICSLSEGYLVIQIVPDPRLMMDLNISYLVDLISFDLSFSLGW